MIQRESVTVRAIAIAWAVAMIGGGNLPANQSESFVDGVSPGSLFRYGVHSLKWTADANGNALMDLGEVESERAGQWEPLTKGEFDHTVKRRRLLMYMPNAYIYKKTPTRDLTLYIDFPTEWKATDKRPVMLWFFGGAWNTGDPAAFKPQADYFAKRGVVGICVDYRTRTMDDIRGDGYISAQDGKTAIRWVRKNAASLGIDPDQVMAGGDSAGGHLAVATQIATLNDPADDLSISGSVSALLLHNPYVVRINDKCWVFQLDFKTLPPVWIAYGGKDVAAYTDDPTTARTTQNGESFIRKLQQAGATLRTYIKEECRHGFCSGGPHLNPSTRDMDDFLQSCGLLPAPIAEVPGEIMRQVVSRHMQKASAGELPRSVPRVLEFANKAN